MQTYCWLGEVMNGATGGVTGQYKRMEALKSVLKTKNIQVWNTVPSASSDYRMAGLESNGEMAGTTAWTKPSNGSYPDQN